MSEDTKEERRSEHERAQWRAAVMERNEALRALYTIAGTLVGKPNESATPATVVLDVKRLVKSAEEARTLIADVVAQLDGAEWTADTCSRIVNVLRAQGFTVNGAPKETL